MPSIRPVAPFLVLVFLGCSAHSETVELPTTVEPTAAETGPEPMDDPRPDERSGTRAQGVAAVCDVASTCHECIVDDLHELARRVCEQFDYPRANPHAQRAACTMTGADDASKATILAWDVDQAGLESCQLLEIIRARLH